MDRRQIAWWLWAIGTILIGLSWFDVVTPTVGWCGFAIGMIGSVMGWGLRPPRGSDDRRREMEHLIERRLSILRTMDWQSLVSLANSADDIEIGGLPAKLHVYGERDDKNQMRIIVQAVRPSATGISALVIARGFLANSDGYIRDLREDEMYEYI